MELYAEAGVKRKETFQTVLIRVALVVGVILSFLVSGLHTILFVLPVIAILGAFFMFPRLNVEYEYVFCDGQIDFDKIMGGNKRKTMLRIDFENVDIVAPSESHALDAHKNNNNLVVKDFSSKNPDAKTYMIVGKASVIGKKGKATEAKEMVRIIFEPSEKMLTCMRNKSPRKVVAY